MIPRRTHDDKCLPSLKNPFKCICSCLKKTNFSCDDIHKASSHIFILLDLKYEEYVGFFAVFVLFELKIGKIHGRDRCRCDAKNTQISLLSHFKDTEVVCFCLQFPIKLLLLLIIVIATMKL